MIKTQKKKKKVFYEIVITYHERRNGSGKLLKTLIIMLSFVTEYISGPGNCPFIKIP